MTKADGACSTLTLLRNTLVEFQNNFLGYPKNVISRVVDKRVAVWALVECSNSASVKKMMSQY